MTMTAVPTLATGHAAVVGTPPGTANMSSSSRPARRIAGDAQPGEPASAGTLGASGAAVQDLLRQRAELPTGHPQRATLRARSIEAGLPLARCVAVRYRGRGEPLDDLYQVAALALVRTVDRYVPARQTSFASYAVPTIVGALKRHFRDTTWRMRVPRRIQELALALNPGIAYLTQHLSRTPTARELAVHLHSTEADVRIALNAWQAYHPDSLDAVSAARGAGHEALIDTLGAVDIRFDAVADRHILRSLVAALPAREQRILALRYFNDMSQHQIAAQVGVSQMHVSRLLTRTLTLLRTGMLAA
jgi:RNA polymerase sigma-B factor